MRKFINLAICLTVVMSVATMASAATSATAASTVAPTLKVNVNVQTAVMLTLSTGASAPGTPCAVNAGGGGDFNVDFGNVNGLGIGTPTCGGVVATTASNATYATSYKLTPSYSGFTATGATISLTAPAFTHSGTLTLVEGDTTGTLTAVPTSGTAHNFAAASSAVTIEHFIGVQVSNSNGATAFPGTAAASGADSTVVTFTMTVP